MRIGSVIEGDRVVLVNDGKLVTAVVMRLHPEFQYPMAVVKVDNQEEDWLKVRVSDIAPFVQTQENGDQISISEERFKNTLAAAIAETIGQIAGQDPKAAITFGVQACILCSKLVMTLFHGCEQ